MPRPFISNRTPPFTPLSTAHIERLQSMVSPDRFSTGASFLELHAKDQSRHPGTRPEAVIWPVSKEEVASVLKYADTHRLPVTGWGAGSSLEGNPVPVCRGLVIDFARMNRILEIRDEDFQADVEPGVVYQDLNERLRHTGLFFPPDPGARATLGGIIANNASGTRSVHYGSARDYVLRLAVALANGEIIQVGSRVRRSSSGGGLLHLFTGSEGTLGLIVEATVRLAGLPEEFSAAVASFPSVESAAGAVYEMIRCGLDPAALELLDAACIGLIDRETDLALPVSPTLFLEFHGPSRAQMPERLDRVREICLQEGCRELRTGLGREERNRLLKARHELGEMLLRTHPGCGILIIDVAVPMTAYPEMIGMAEQLLKETGLTGYTFSHAGEGNIHLNLVGKEGDRKTWSLIDKVNCRMVEKALSLGGTATGEHGVGIGKRKFMKTEHGESLFWMKRIKDLFDPNGILNPGKIFPE